MSTNERTARKPILFSIAIFAAALIMPLLIWLDGTATSGGDGLQTFWSGAMIFGGCALLSVLCMVVGIIRGERPRWLILISLCILAWLVLTLMF
jgi:hypothetical protein